MKTILLVLLLALSFAREGCASGPLTVEIMTTDRGVSYTLEKYGLRLDGDPKTPDEIETWLRGAVKAMGDREVIFIHPDDHTSFKTVQEMLRRFKAAGVKRFVVWTGAPNGPNSTLSGSLDDLRLSRLPP